MPRRSLSRLSLADRVTKGGRGEADERARARDAKNWRKASENCTRGRRGRGYPSRGDFLFFSLEFLGRGKFLKGGGVFTGSFSKGYDMGYANIIWQRWQRSGLGFFEGEGGKKNAPGVVAKCELYFVFYTGGFLWGEFGFFESVGGGCAGRRQVALAWI